MEKLVSENPPNRVGSDLDDIRDAVASFVVPHKLRSYQFEGISFLLQNESALLADEMGLGKTIQVIIALRLLLLRRLANRVLIVTPSSLRTNWKSELARWAPDLNVRMVSGSSDNRATSYLLPIPVIIATYEQIRLDSDSLNRREIFDVVVLDEAQRIKSSRSQTAMACNSLPRRSSWALTGTPVENSPDELISIFFFLKPGLLYTGISKSDLHRRIKSRFLRRTRSKVLQELPDIITQDLRLKLVGEQRSAYTLLWNERRSFLPTQNVREGHLLSLITKLKQLCNYEPKSGESVKLDALRLILENCTLGSDKIVVFSQYVETLYWLEKQLKHLAVNIYHGKLNIGLRDDVIRSFRDQKGPRILLMSLRTGGVGLNLPETTTVVLFDRWWNPAIEQQAISRAIRLGRTHPLHVVKFLTDNTIEERIEKLLIFKKLLFTEYVEEAENANVQPLSRAKLQEILEFSTK